VFFGIRSRLQELSQLAAASHALAIVAGLTEVKEHCCSWAAVGATVSLDLLLDAPWLQVQVGLISYN
jgi:hypothetical protein